MALLFFLRNIDDLVSVYWGSGGSSERSSLRYRSSKKRINGDQSKSKLHDHQNMYVIFFCFNMCFKNKKNLILIKRKIYPWKNTILHFIFFFAWRLKNNLILLEDVHLLKGKRKRYQYIFNHLYNILRWEDIDTVHTVYGYDWIESREDYTVLNLAFYDEQNFLK